MKITIEQVIAVFDADGISFIIGEDGHIQLTGRNQKYIEGYTKFLRSNPEIEEGLKCALGVKGMEEVWQAAQVQATDKQPETKANSIAQEGAHNVSGEYCGINEFIKVITSTYGMGIMDTFYDRNSPSWLQVWFTAEEVTEEARSKGYSLNLSRTKEYLTRLLRSRGRLIEERTTIERGREYRRVRLMSDSCIR